MRVVMRFNKRRAEISVMCEQLRQRRYAMQYHQQAVKHDTLAICRRPSTLGAAFVAGGLLGFIAGPSSESPHSESVQTPQAKGPVRKAAELALVSYLSTLFRRLPEYLQSQQPAGSPVDASSQPPAA